MRSLKKRILSFLSAMALTATLLPSASLFASAASNVETFYARQNGVTNAVALGDVTTPESDENFLNAGNGNWNKWGLPIDLSSYASSDVESVTLNVYAQGTNSAVAFLQTKDSTYDGHSSAVAMPEAGTESNPWNAGDVLAATFELTTDQITYAVANNLYAVVQTDSGYINYSKVEAKVGTADSSSEAGSTTTETLVASSDSVTVTSWGGSNNSLQFDLSGYDSGKIVITTMSGNVPGVKIALNNDWENTLHNGEYTSGQSWDIANTGTKVTVQGIADTDGVVKVEVYGIKSTTVDSSSESGSETTEVLFDGEQALDWNNSAQVDLSAIGTWESAKITITFSGNSGQFKVGYNNASGDWTTPLGDYVDISSTTYEWTLDATALADLATQSWCIQGSNATVTNVTITGVKSGDTPTPETYTMTAATANETMGSASVNNATVEAGGDAIFTATANDGYEFVNWTDATGGEVSTSNPYTATNVSADISLTANFREIVPVGVTLQSGVTTTVTANDITLFNHNTSDNKGSADTCTELTDTAYSTTEKGTEADIYIKPNADAATEEVAFPFNLSAESDLSVKVSYNAYQHGSSYANIFMDSTLTPPEGYAWAGGADTEYVKYDGKTYRKLVSTELTASSSWDAQTKSYSVNNLPAGDYIFTTWLPNYNNFFNVALTANSNPKHTLTATYEDASAMATLGTIEDSFSNTNRETITETVREGDVYIVIARSNENSQFRGWYDAQGNLVTYNARYEVTMGTEDISLYARFEVKTGEEKTEEAKESVIIKGTEDPSLIGFNNEDPQYMNNGEWWTAGNDSGATGYSDDVYTTGNSKMDITSIPDAMGVIQHNVWKIDYEFNPAANWQEGDSLYKPYTGYYQAKPTVDAPLEGLTGFTFWYRTDPGVGADEKFVYVLQSNAFTLPEDETHNGGITAYLSGTDGVWTQAFVPFDTAYQDPTATRVTSWDMFVNKVGRTADGGNVIMENDKGSFYIADFEIVATTIDGDGVDYTYTFIYQDIFGNTLKTEVQTQHVGTVYNESTGNFEPVSGAPNVNPNPPEYVQVQGRTFNGWQYVDTIGGTLTGKYDYAGLKALTFAPGVYTFTAQYEMDPDFLTVSVNGGDLYISADESDTACTYKVPASAAGEDGRYTRIPYYGNVRLVANDKTRTFSHWELNGMVYSYDEEIFFSTWCDASFVAVYIEDGTPTVKPTAFIDKFVHVYGFDNLENINQHRINYDVSFYAGNTTIVEAGIIYAATEDALNIAFLPTDTDIASSTLKAAKPSGTAVISLLNSQLNNLINGTQYLAAIGNVDVGKTRIARSYLIYLDAQGKRHIVYSDGLATAVTPTETSAAHIIQVDGVALQ